MRLQAVVERKVPQMLSLKHWVFFYSRVMRSFNFIFYFPTPGILLKRKWGINRKKLPGSLVSHAAVEIRQ